VLEESSAISIFRVEAYFDPEDGGNIFPRNICVHPNGCMLSQTISPLPEEVSNPLWNPKFYCIFFMKVRQWTYPEPLNSVPILSQYFIFILPTKIFACDSLFICATRSAHFIPFDLFTLVLSGGS
jgi:hypothetical protein